MAKNIRKPAPRFDRTRQPESKARALSRKGQRIAKSARLFLAFAFPAEFAI
jgi:hypothetical protein